MQRYICREELVLLLEKGFSPGWWDKKVHKITYKIVSELTEFPSEVKDTQENCAKRALFALDDRILLKKETKIFNIKKKLIDSLKTKLITLSKSMKHFIIVNHVILLETSVIKLV